MLQHALQLGIRCCRSALARLGALELLFQPFHLSSQPRRRFTSTGVHLGRVQIRGLEGVPQTCKQTCAHWAWGHNY